MPILNAHFRLAALPVQPALKNTAAGILLAVLGLHEKGKVEGAELLAREKRQDHEVLTYKVTGESDIVKLLRAILKIEDQRPGLSPAASCLSYSFALRKYAQTGFTPLLGTLLPPADEFKFLYQDERLIGIFPLPAEQTSNLGAKYLSLAPYYGEIYPYREVANLCELRRLWQVQNKFWRQAHCAIDHFVGETKIRFGPFRNDAGHAFASIRLDQADEFCPLPFTLDQITDFIDGKPLLRNRLPFIFPVLPTVYPPVGEHADADQAYNLAIKALHLRGKTCLVGGGTGANEGISLGDCETWVSDLNPFAVANCLATSLGVPFRLEEAAVADNVVNGQNEPVFPGQRFDHLLWNMPTLMPKTYDGIFYLDESLAGQALNFPHLNWEDDDGRTILRLAQGLPLVLAPRGRAILWNKPYTVHLRSEAGVSVGELVDLIFASGGRLKYYGATDYSLKTDKRIRVSALGRFVYQVEFV